MYTHAHIYIYTFIDAYIYINSTHISLKFGIKSNAGGSRSLT